MLRLLRTRLLNPDLTYSSPKLIFFPQIRSPINQYCSLSEKRQVKSERVVSFFKDNGFSDHHITRISRSRPSILFADPHKTLAPKFDFFRSLGISNTDLPKFISSDPNLLHLSLKNQLVPCQYYLKSLLHTDENVARVVMRRPWILQCNIEKKLAPNINVLSDIGVPESRIQYMLMNHPRALKYGHTHFKSKVEEVVSLGFDQTRCAFLDAVSLLCGTKKTTIERNWAAYRNQNLTDDEIRAAFHSFPNCMTISVDKITRVLDFLVNRMGFEAVKIMTNPAAVSYNLEKRIIPRCRVINVLQSHGIVKKDIGISTFLFPSEINFLKKFVSKYEDEVPGLLKIYTGKMDHLETGTESVNIDATK